MRDITPDPVAKFWSEFHSTVYFLECLDKTENLYVKVGKSNNPAERVTGLICGLPLHVHRVRYVGITSSASALKLEKCLQQYLAPWHARGEWFFFPKDDHHGMERYTFGISGQLDCYLCRGAWKYQEIDWPAYELAKQCKLNKYLAENAHKKKKHLKSGFKAGSSFTRLSAA